MENMPELHIRMKQAPPRIDADLVAFAEQQDCDLEPLEAGFLLLPDVMLRKYGVFVFPADGGWKVCREEDATTWEDYLLMKLAHTLADKYEGAIYVSGQEQRLETAPENFATFDHYVETVVAFEQDLVKEMKKYWLYAHRKRALR